MRISQFAVREHAGDLLVIPIRAEETSEQRKSVSGFQCAQATLGMCRESEFNYLILLIKNTRM